MSDPVKPAGGRGTIKSLTSGAHEHDQSLGPTFTRRALLLGAGQMGLMGLLVAKLHDLQVNKSARIAPLADENRIRVMPVAPVRGQIRDVRGRLLAGNETVRSLDIVPGFAGDVREVLERLRAVIDVPDEAVARVLAQARRQPGLLPIPVDVALDWDAFARLSALAPDLPGVQPVERQNRIYGHTAAMGHMVGFLGAVERFPIDGDPALHLPGMRIGKIGVEEGREQTLRGRGGAVRREVDARGRFVRDIDERMPIPGRDVSLTVDAALQAQVLSRVRRAGRAASVIMDVHSGAIIAMASAPSLDTGQFEGGITPAEWRKLRTTPGRPLIDKTVRGEYPPGSTFKIVSALAGLEAGIVMPRTILRCNGSHELAGQTFRCWNGAGHGRVNLHRALRESCNVYFYKLAEELGISRLAAMGERLGLGVMHDFELSNQRQGVMPTPGWKQGNLGRRWFGGETLLAAIGQGYVLTTPLQLAVMGARVAGGTLVSPRLTTDRLQSRWPALDIDPAHLAAVRRGLWGVVNEGAGTARRAALWFNGIQMAGKTGTAQVQARRVNGRTVTPAPHALFVGYAPADRPRVAISVIVENGGGGSKAAAPLARDLLRIVLASGAITKGPETQPPAPHPRRRPGPAPAREASTAREARVEPPAGGRT